MSHRAQPMMRLAVLSIAMVAALLAVIWASPSGGAPAANAQPVPVASMSLAKVCSPEAAVGGLVQYTFTIKNTGDQGLDRDSVIDSPNLGDLTSSFSAHLDPGQSDQVVRFYIVQESDPRPLVNTVTATYTSDDGTVLVVDTTCSVDVPHLSITKIATFNPDGTTTLTFELTNDGTEPVRRFMVIDSVLGNITSQFPLELAVGETVVVQITVPGEICENTVTAVYQSVPRSSTVTATAECGQDERGGLEIVQNNPDGTLFTDATVTFHICSGVVVLCDAGNAGITTTSNPSGLIFLDAGTFTVCVEEPAGFVVDPPACQTPVVTLGGTVSVVFITRPEGGDGEGCTPGFWRNARNGRKLWDEASDAIPQAIGAALGIDPAVVAAIDPASDYYLVFMVAPGTQGLPDPFTTNAAIRIGGGQEKKLARHGMAALLNAAAVNFPLSITEVKNAVRDALISGNFEPLATQLNDSNNLSPDCPANNLANGAKRLS